MNLNRRQMIKGIGAALCAGMAPRFVAELVGGTSGLTGYVVTEVNPSKGIVTLSSFQDMLNDYCSTELLIVELNRASYMLPLVIDVERFTVGDRIEFMMPDSLGRS